MLLVCISWGVSPGVYLWSGVTDAAFQSLPRTHGNQLAVRAPPTARRPSLDNMPGLGKVPRPQDFGRYDPLTHTLVLDREATVPPGHTVHPLALKVGEKGRLHAVLASHDSEVLARAQKAGVPMHEPFSETHEHHKGRPKRPEQFGRYDPISSSLAFKKADGSEHTVRVGDNGRLRAVLESGAVDERQAREIGLPMPEAYKGKAKPPNDPGWFNPLTHEYNVNSSPRDFARTQGRRTTSSMPTFVTKTGIVSPRINPLTQKLDPINCEPHTPSVHARLLFFLRSRRASPRVRWQQRRGRWLCTTPTCCTR